MIILLAVLFIFIIISAVVAIEAKNLRSSLLALAALGIGTSLIFLLLRAPGLALAQLVFMFLGFIILMRSIISADLTAFGEGREILGLAVVGIMIITIFIFGLEVMRELPRFGKPLLAGSEDTVAWHYLSQGLKETGKPNIVKAIILDYRGYDTLGLAAIIFTTILGTLAILRKKK